MLVMCLMLLYTLIIYTVFCGTGGCGQHTKRSMDTSFCQAAHGRLLPQAVPGTRRWGPHNWLSVLPTGQLRPRTLHYLQC